MGPLRMGWRVKRCLNLLAWLLGFREWLGSLIPGKGYANASFMWAFGAKGPSRTSTGQAFLYKKRLECGMFGSFLALCRSRLGCGRATGFLTWENRRRERKCDLCCGTMPHSRVLLRVRIRVMVKSRGYWQRWLRRARRGRERRARALEGMRVRVLRSTRNRIRRWTGWPLRKRACVR